MATYLYSYSYNGARYSLAIPADSRDEAEGRIQAIKSWRVDYDGELVAEIPAVPGAGVFVRLATWLRNWIRG